MNNKQKKLGIVLLLMIFCACNSNKKEYKELSTIHHNEKVNYTIGKIKLFDSVTSLMEKYALSNFYTKNDTEFVAFMNRLDTCFYVYNISTKKIKKKYPIKNINISNSHIYNTDSVFLFEFDAVYLLTDLGIKRWGINLDTNSVTCIDFLDNNRAYFDSKKQELVLQQFSCTVDFDSDSFFMNSPITLFNISTQELRTPPITYSNKYFTNYYGFLNKVYISSDENKTYLSYAIDPNIYIVDRKNLTQKIIGGKSKYQKIDENPLDTKYRDNIYSDKKIQHLTVAYSYSTLLIDEKRKMYYRFFLNSLPEKNEKGLFNTYKDKETILMVFNENMEVIKEFVFSKSYNLVPGFAYVGKDGLYVYAKDGFVLLKINKHESH